MAKNIEHGADGTELELEAGYNESRAYELGFHIDPELPQEEVKKAYQSIREKAAKAGAILAEGEPQKIPLAYTISRSEHAGRRDFDSAYFAWIAYEAEGAAHDAFVSSLKGETKLIRFIDLRTTKEAAQHSAELHEFYLQAAANQERPEEAEAVSDAQLDAALKSAEA